MNYTENIEHNAERIISGLPKKHQSNIKLYSHGAVSKITNAEYAFNKLKELNQSDDTTTSTNIDNDLPPSEKICFYLDAFFAFLYSVYDVAGQIINQKLRINCDEQKVSFKYIKFHLNRYYNGTQVQKNVDALIKTNYFTNLERYRNCSTHRRQICIKIETSSVEITPGYNATDAFKSTTRVLCDDPLKINPSFDQKRELIDYCEKMLMKTKTESLKILKSL